MSLQVGQSVFLYFTIVITIGTSHEIENQKISSKHQLIN